MSGMNQCGIDTRLSDCWLYLCTCICTVLLAYICTILTYIHPHTPYIYKMETRQWTLASKPSSLPTLTGPNPTFTLTTTTLPALQPSQLLLKPIYFSNDPGLRPWISAHADPARQYLPPIHEGEAMRAFAIARVLQSTDSSIPPETLVSTFTEWRELSICNASECQVLAPLPGLSISHFLGALGSTAITAYYGLKEIAKVQPGELVVVSGAAGATGGMAVQIASKLFGCRVFCPSLHTYSGIYIHG